MAAIIVAILAGTLVASPPALAARATQITANTFHTCALTAAGAVKCWGGNMSGQLGDGTTHLRLRPVGVTGLARGVTQISAGKYHTCALTAAGAVRCWGANHRGQLGDNSTTERHTSVDVTGLARGVTQITAGKHHTCALTAAGAARCWGYNYYGQLGDGTTHPRLKPVGVTGLARGVTQITAGKHHTCALTTAGAVKCWGSNDDGQLGDGSRTERHRPVGVTGLASGVIQINAGTFHTCALTAAGAVKCWGRNDDGQLGDGGRTERHRPVGVTGLTSGATQISAGGSHTCALIGAGAAKCWGYNYYGQLGDGTTHWRLKPVGVTGLAGGVIQISAAHFHTCALTAAGAVKCWGSNGSGKLGDNSRRSRHVPVFVYAFGGVATTTTLRSSRPKAQVGETLVYRARVSPAPTSGRVTFIDGKEAIRRCRRVPVVNGRASCTVRYESAGTHQIAASYSGSVVHKASTSARLVQVVG